MVTKTVCQLPVQRKVAAARWTSGWRSAARGVVLLGDRPLLHPERLGRVAADLFELLRRPAAGGRQGIAHGDDSGQGQGRLGEHVGQRLPADVAVQAVADPVAGGEGVPRLRPAAVEVVAEAQVGAAPVVHLGDEVAMERTARQQVAPCLPRVAVGVEGDRRQGVGGVEGESGGGGGRRGRRF